MREGYYSFCVEIAGNFGRKQNKGIGKRFYCGSGSFDWLPWKAFKIDGMGSILGGACSGEEHRTWAFLEWQKSMILFMRMNSLSAPNEKTLFPNISL